MKDISVTGLEPGREAALSEIIEDLMVEVDAIRRRWKSGVVSITSTPYYVADESGLRIRFDNEKQRYGLMKGNIVMFSSKVAQVVADRLNAASHTGRFAPIGRLEWEGKIVARNIDMANYFWKLINKYGEKK